MAGFAFHEAADAEAEEAQRLLDEFVAGEEIAAEPIDGAGFLGGVLDGELAGEGLEIFVADFYLDGLGEEALAFEAGGDVLGLGPEASAQLGAVHGVALEGFFAADAFDFVAKFEGAIVDAEGIVAQGTAEGADEGAEVAGMLLEIAEGEEAGLVEDFFGGGADAVNFADGQFAEEFGFAGLADEGEAVGLLEVTGEFGEEFVGGDADAGGDTALAANGFLHRAADGERGFEEFVMRAAAGFEKVGEFHVGFVDGDLFDGRARVAHDVHDFAGFFAIEIDAGRDENPVRAEAAGGGAGHGGADAEFAGFVAGGANDAAAFGRAADNDRFAFEGGIFALLDRGVKGVHIEVKDYPILGVGGLWRTVVHALAG